MLPLPSSILDPNILENILFWYIFKPCLFFQNNLPCFIMIWTGKVIVFCSLIFRILRAFGIKILNWIIYFTEFIIFLIQHEPHFHLWVIFSVTEYLNVVVMPTMTLCKLCFLWCYLCLNYLLCFRWCVTAYKHASACDSSWSISNRIYWRCCSPFLNFAVVWSPVL
jgi:hypothetical protein